MKTLTINFSSIKQVFKISYQNKNFFFTFSDKDNSISNFLSLFPQFKPQIISFKYNRAQFKWSSNFQNKLWGPSIDSFILINTIFSYESNFMKKQRKIIDIGAGSGVLGNLLIKLFPNINECHYFDSNKNAAQYILANNKSINNKETHTKWVTLIDNKFDCIIVNAPYIPFYKSTVPKQYRDFSGLELISKTFSNSSQILNKGGKIYIIYSDMVKNYINEISKKNKFSQKILHQQLISMKIDSIIGNKTWLNFLLKIGLIKKDNSYYHKIIVSCFYHN